MAKRLDLKIYDNGDGTFRAVGPDGDLSSLTATQLRAVWEAAYPPKAGKPGVKVIDSVKEEQRERERQKPDNPKPMRS